MAANVLNSARASEVSVLVVRAFIKLRQILASHKDLADQLARPEQKVGGHDQAISSLIAAIRKLMASPPRRKKGKTGFGREHEK